MYIDNNFSSISFSFASVICIESQQDFFLEVDEENSLITVQNCDAGVEIELLKSIPCFTNPIPSCC